MVDFPTLLVFLAILSICAVVGTIALCLTVADLRRMLNRMNRFFSHGEAAGREAQRALSTSRQFLERANGTAAHVRRVIERSCEMAEEALEEVDLFRKKTHAFWTRYLGNGTRPRPRRLHRGRG